MPESIKAALTTALAEGACPADIQYMPPGRHRIHASRGGQPVSLEIVVDASTADTLNRFLQAQLAKAEGGADDRPFFDFNHEDREAAAWPTEFFWAGDDPQTGGVRASVEWSGAGKTAIEQRTFRRFSPTFIPDAQGRVIGSETNMGGLVNRAAFKTIQPLFAKGEAGNPKSKVPDPETMPTEAPPPATAQDAPKPDPLGFKVSDLGFDQLREENRELRAKVQALEEEKAAAVRARASAHVENAVKAGRLAPADADGKAFWQDALIRDEAKAVKALEALPANPVLQPVTAGEDAKAGALNRMALQQQKLAEARAANPAADFATIFAKAQSAHPDLFR